MHWKTKFLNLLSNAWLWLRYTPRVTEWSSALAVLVLMACWIMGYGHLASVAGLPAPEEAEPSGFVRAYEAMEPYLRLGALLGSVVAMIHIGRVLPDTRRLVKPVSAIFSYIAVWAVLDELHSHWEAGAAGAMGEPISVFYYWVKVVILALAIVSPPFVLVWYSRLKLLERYTLKNFVQPLAFCLIAFFSLFVLIDIIDNMRDYQEAGIGMGTLAGFYFSLIPHIYVYPTLPAALMLAVLYALMKMSRANEIISMLTAGRSLWEILRPVFVVSAYASFLSMAANYHWGPRGEAKRASLMMSDKKTASVAQMNTMYHNVTTDRTWFVGSMPFDPTRDTISQLEVRQLDEKGRIVTGWYAKRARWWPNGLWFLYNGIKVNYEKGVAVSQEAFTPMTGGMTRMSVREWTETPWTLISGALTPDNLGVPDLASYLNANTESKDAKLAAFRTHFMQRFALPWQALVLVFMAAPLGVSFSRRGALGGIAGSVFMFFGLMFLNNLFMNLGKGGRIPALVAVWMPHLIVGFLALVFFRLRSMNQDIPKPGQWFPWLRDWALEVRENVTDWLAAKRSRA